MPIPLANRLGQLNAPKAEAGRAYDASQDYSQMGQMATHSIELAQKAAENMGAALQLVQRQKEDIIAKEAILQYEKELTDAQTALEQHQGLDAEEYRNGKYREAMQKAQNNFNSAISRVKFSDIRNNAVQNNRDAVINSDAKADMYVYKENLAARNNMSNSMLEFYKRQAKVSIFNPDFVNIEKDMAENTAAEVENIAGLNGYTDPTYIKLKKQEALDNYYSAIAEEISHEHNNGFVLAKGYLADKKKNGEITTAAYDKILQDLEADELTYQVMKNPNMFFKNGHYDEDLAASIAPDLNDRQRLRIIHSCKASSANGGTAADAKNLEGIAERYSFEVGESFERMGLANPAKLKFMVTKDQKEEYSAEMEANLKSTRFSDKFKEYYNNMYVPAKVNIVINKNTGKEMPLSKDPNERKKQLNSFKMDPQNYTVIQNFTALGDKEFKEADKAFNNLANIRTKNFDVVDAGLEPSTFTSVEFSFFDAYAQQLHHQYGFAGETIKEIFTYMMDNKDRMSPIVDPKTGKTIGYKRDFEALAGFDFFKQGEYDSSSKALKEAADSLLSEAISEKTGGSGDKIYQGRDNIDSLETFINRMRSAYSGQVVKYPTAAASNWENFLRGAALGTLTSTKGGRYF